MIKILIIFVLVLLIILHITSNIVNEHMTQPKKHNLTIDNQVPKYSYQVPKYSYNVPRYSYNVHDFTNQPTPPNSTSVTRDIYQNISKCNDSMFSKCNDSMFTKYLFYTGIIEITELPLYQGHVDANYQCNINTINNNSTSLFQEIVDPLSSTCDINFNNYNLIKVEFRKSKFSYNNNAVGLELHLVHINYDSLPNYNIIIPLDLTNDPYYDNTENFVNILYKKMDFTVKPYENEFAKITDETQLDATILKNNNIYNIIQGEKGIFNLNLNYKRPYDIILTSVNEFIDDSNLIINYECCGTIIGQVKQFNLFLLNSIINSTSNFHKIQDENENIYLISEPIPFNEDIGLLIRTNLIDNPNTLYINSN